MNDSIPPPPKPPIPPSSRLQCCACGYTALETECKHTCWSGLLFSISLTMVPIIIFLSVIIKMVEL